MHGVAALACIERPSRRHRTVIVGGYAAAMKNRPFHERLGFAITGIATVWRRERSLQAQVLIVGLTGIALLLLRPDWLWSALPLSSAVLVLTLEMANAALEYFADQVHPDIAPDIAAAKDAAAGAVLLAGGGALVTAVLMLGDIAYRCFS